MRPICYQKLLPLIFLRVPLLQQGATARETNRASGSRGLIKDGKEQAVVEVVIANKGKNAYEPDVFGDKIVVRRKINQARPENAPKVALCLRTEAHMFTGTTIVFPTSARCVTRPQAFSHTPAPP